MSQIDEHGEERERLLREEILELEEENSRMKGMMTKITKLQEHHGSLCVKIATEALKEIEK